MKKFSLLILLAVTTALGAMIFLHRQSVQQHDRLQAHTEQLQQRQGPLRDMSVSLEKYRRMSAWICCLLSRLTARVPGGEDARLIYCDSDFNRVSGRHCTWDMTVCDCKLAHAALTLHRAGPVTVTIRLTRHGRSLLRHAQHLRLTAEASFTPVGGKTVRAARPVRIARRPRRR